MCSCARIGLPAATRPTSGSVSCARLGSGRLNCLPRALVERAQCVGLQADAARGAADQLDDALARQRLQVLFGRVGGAKAELGGDLGAGGRGAGALDGALHQVENLLLAVGELGAFLHVASGSLRATALSDSSSGCIFIQTSTKMQSIQQTTVVVILGTGGTIAGTAADAGDNVGYTRRADRRRRSSSAAVPALAGPPLEAEQVAQLDSKDMDYADLAAPGAARRASPGAAPRWPASSSRTAPTRWRRPPTSCSACWRRPSRWC